MLLKYFAIIYINVFLSDAINKYGSNNVTINVTDKGKKDVCVHVMRFRRNEEKSAEEKPIDEISTEDESMKLNSTELKTSTVLPIIGLYPNSTSNREKLKGQEGRYLTKHFPITCDGYILTLFHLTFEHHITPSKNRPVLLVTGMFQSSDRFLQQSENQSLAFKLQDLGYDVWLANARGNKYSRRHLYLEPEKDEKNEYFDYSYEEIGLYDIAATIDFIRNWTVYEKIHYIGYSLGGTAFLVLNSLKPKYNAYFDVAFLLAPFAYQNFFPHHDLKRDLYDLEIMYRDLLKVGVAEIFPINSTEKNQRFVPGNCLGDTKYENICTHLDIQTVMGLNNDINVKDNTRGGSIKQLIHLAQNVHSGSFRRWHYKEDKDNQKMYGVITPPEYDLSLVTVPTVIYYSAGDEYVARRDIDGLAKKIAGAITVKVKKKNFKHDHFISDPDVMTVVYNDIISKFPENPNQAKPSDDKDKTPILLQYIPRILIATVGAGLCIFVGVKVVTNFNKLLPDRTVEAEEGTVETEHSMSRHENTCTYD